MKFALSLPYELWPASPDHAEALGLGAVFEITRRSAYALRVRGKPSWAGVALGGTGRWPASTSVALAEHGFPLTEHRLILKTAPGGVLSKLTDFS